MGFSRVWRVTPLISFRAHVQDGACGARGRGSPLPGERGGTRGGARGHIERGAGEGRCRGRQSGGGRRGWQWQACEASGGRRRRRGGGGRRDGGAGGGDAQSLFRHVATLHDQRHAPCPVFPLAKSAESSPCSPDRRCPLRWRLCAGYSTVMAEVNF